MVAGLTNGELIAPMTYEEMMTSDFFEAWFQKFLLPTLTTPSVIIMDNARFHRMGKLELLCEEFGFVLFQIQSTIYHNGQRASCQEITVILVKKEAEKFHFLLLFYRIYFSFSELLTSAFLADLI
ncbi:IS630-Spn1, transposase Orf2 [Streptococcus pneumoniae]|nr:IS630-Spn1, transposase Orf2 [Streptococcus pneumoniae]